MYDNYDDVNDATLYAADEMDRYGITLSDIAEEDIYNCPDPDLPPLLTESL